MIRVLALALALAACGDSSTEGPDGADAGAGSGSGVVDETFETRFTVTEFTVDNSFVPIEAANTCLGVRTDEPQMPDPDCSLSDRDGIVSFELPAGEGAVTIFRTLFTRAIVAFDLMGDYESELDVPNSAVVDGVATMVMAPWPAEDRGIVTVTIRDGSGNKLAGAEVSMKPDDGIGGVYTDGLIGLPNKALTETTDTGMILFMDVAPGEHELTVSHPELDCGPGESWPSDEGTATIPVEAETNTLASIVCD